MNFELLEQRTLLSLSAFIDGTATLRVYGDTGNNDVTLRLDPLDPALLQVDDAATPGADFSFATADFVDIWVATGDGNDKVTIDESGGTFSDTKPTYINGGSDDDSLVGGSGGETIVGGTGNDTVEGGPGDDHLYGQDGDDWIDGGAGNDTLSGALGNDTLYGGEGDDRLYAHEGDDELHGDEGNDWAYGYAGSDTAYGGPGDDRLYGQEDDDELRGGPDNDVIRAGAGNDTAIGGTGDDNVGGDDGDDSVDGAAGNDTVIGGTGNDTLFGRDGDDRLYGQAGNDLMYGHDGNDSAYGDAGMDTIDGSTGEDRLYGQGDNDELRGGPGNDVLRGGDGDDTVKGGLGDDNIGGDAGNDRLYGRDGNDRLYGHDGDDRIYGEDGNDSAYGGAGKDTIDGEAGDDWLYGQDGRDKLDGGPGNDVMRGGEDADTLRGGPGADNIGGDGGNDKLYGQRDDDTIGGGLGDDVLYGNKGNDRLYGHDGDDTLYGQAGDDGIYGQAGNDLGYGGEGNDSVYGYAGNDTMYGDAGDDRVYGQEGEDELYGGMDNDVVRGGPDNDRAEGGMGDDNVGGDDGNDLIYGNDGNDTLVGGLDDDVLYGQAGDDRLYGQDGDDVLYGQDGNDRLYGQNGDDQAYGDDGNDSVYGYAGDDTLAGGEGDDWLYGMDDNDEMDGGPGSDTVRGGNGDDLARGGDGADVVWGDAGNDVLLGGADDDELRGGTERDIFIGGTGADQLRGDDDDDLLVGSTSAFDEDNDALNAIRAAWTSADDYYGRVATLEDEANPVYLKAHETVFADADQDVLTGNNGTDWYFHFDPDMLMDWTALEQISLHGGHGHPVLQAEHHALMALVADADVTHTAIQTGPWSDPATWQNGAIPDDGAHVLVLDGVTVTVDAEYGTELDTMRVDGTLQFDPTQNTSLWIDLLVVSASGTFNMGTEAEPIAPDVTAKLVLGDSEPIDVGWDPHRFSKGLITHGEVNVHGTEVTGFLPLAGAPAAGGTTLYLSAVPTGWKVGDELILPGVNPRRNEDEVLTIQAIAGTEVTVSALAYDHIPPVAGNDVHVANTTRNAIFESYSTDVDSRGHVMFMHSEDVDVHYAGFYGLGRTDKTKPINDPAFDPDGNLIPGTGTNRRARYAVHFHRTGINPYTDLAAVVAGSVVKDSPGWGFVNHSSNVIFEDNVAYNVVGSSFVTETGEEVGAFRHNIAIRSTGSGEGINNREDVQDFGHQGDGFWFQGAGTYVEDNVAVGQRHAGYVVFTRGLIQEGLGTAVFLSANLPDPSIADGADTMRVGDVPLFGFSGNVAYASGTGFESWFHQLSAKHEARSLVEGLDVWNVSSNRAIFTPYTRQMTLRDVNVYGNGLRGTGISRNDVTNDMLYENVHVEGFYVGLSVPVRGNVDIQGGYYNNVRNFEIYTAVLPRNVTIAADVQFGTLTPAELGGHTQYDVYMRSRLTPRQNDLSSLFHNDQVLLDAQQIYFNEQQPDYVPFPSATAPAYVPDVLVDMTNQQMWDTYALTIGGTLATADAAAAPRIHGLLGSPGDYLPTLTLRSAKYTSQLTGYELKYLDAAGTMVTDPTPEDLAEGWNLINRTIDGNLRTFLVFGDVTPPTFVVHPSVTLEIPESHLSLGFYLVGTIVDNSTGNTGFRRTFYGLDTLPIYTRTDGSRYVVLEFTVMDRARNTTDVALELTVLS